MNFKSPQREFVVSSHKYNMRALGICDGTNDIEPRLSRHLNVQEHQVRPMPMNRVHRFSRPLRHSQISSKSSHRCDKCP